MTGRYQPRFGHEFNTAAAAGHRACSSSETTMADRLKAAGYATGIVGKWHLGDGQRVPAGARGFDFSASAAWTTSPDKGGRPTSTAAPRCVEPPKEYRSRAALRAGGVRRSSSANKDKPFFLYLAFNAVHTPHEATERVAQAVRPPAASGSGDYAAMHRRWTTPSARVLAKLPRREAGGGHAGLLLQRQRRPVGRRRRWTALRGRQGDAWRAASACRSWCSGRAACPAGRSYDQPVIQLDILPTALAAAGADGQAGVEARRREPAAATWRARPTELAARGALLAVRRADGDPQGRLEAGEGGEGHEADAGQPARRTGASEGLSSEHRRRRRQLWRCGRSGTRTTQPPRWTDRRWDGEEARKKMKKGE